MKKNKNVIDFPRLCIKCLSGNSSKDENALLDELVTESERNKAEYEKIKMIWNGSLYYKETELPDPSVGWTKLNNSISLEENRSRRIKAADRKRLSIKLKPALAAAALVMAAIAVFIIWRGYSSVPKIKLLSTGAGEHTSIKLADGTNVILNENSSISFPEYFKASEREVELKGEAFFSVMKDNKQFVVLTQNAAATVLGTKFDVSAMDNRTKVIVKEGIVKLNPIKETGESVRIIKNQLSTVKGDLPPSIPETVNAAFLLGWTEGKIVFYKTPLNEVVIRLTNYYKIPVVLKDENLGKLTLTGSFGQMSIESVLSSVCLALNVKYINQNGKYVIETK